MMISFESIVQAVITGILIGGMYGLLSIGLTLIYGVMKLVNFAHGEFLMVGMYITYWLWFLLGLDPFLSSFLVFPMMFLLGCGLFILLIRPLIKGRPMALREKVFLPDPHLSQIFITLGVSILLQNVILILWKADYRSITVWYTVSAVELGSITLNLARLFSFVCCMILGLIIFILLLRTDFGKAVRAVTSDRDTAGLMGIDVDRINLIAFGLGIAITAVAGSFIASFLYIYPTVGSFLGLLAYIVVVLGGYGSVSGTVLAGFVIGEMESLSVLIFPAEFQYFGPFLLFILILILRPEGLFKGGRL
jgi:branched-chain amino acid transport system permease protein